MNSILNLIESNFYFTDENYKTRQISVGKKSDNEVFIPGQSSTQRAKAHQFKIGEMTIQIIDTPGYKFIVKNIKF